MKYSHGTTEVRDLWARKCALFLILAGASLTTLAADQFSYDIRLVTALADQKMGDYASLQVERLLKKYPDRKDRIYLAQAHALYIQNKRSAGNEILQKIPAASPFFAQSRLLIAGTAFERQDYDQAAKAYASFFEKNKAPVTDQPEDVETFIAAVQMYAQIYINQGNGKQASDILDYLKNVKGDRAIDQANIDYLKGKAVLAAADARQDSGEELDKKSIAEAVKLLEGIQLRQITNYRLIVNSLTEVAHGYVLLDNPGKALETLKSMAKILGQVRDSVKDKSQSPLAGAYFYYGKALKGEAFAAFKSGDKETAKKRLVGALKYFREITTNYKGSPYETQGLVEFGKVKQLLAGMGVQIGEDEDSGQVAMTLERADKMLSAKNFGKAADLYFEALRLGRTHRKVPDTILKLAYCLGERGDFLEAQALADYAYDAFPEAPRTGDALLQVGNSLLQKSKSVQNPEEKEQFMERTVALWERFVDAAPQHESAPTVAYFIAEYYYSKAQKVADQSRQITDAKRREEAKAKARQLYRNAIPRYTKLVDVFGSTPQGIRAYYKLGWIYHTLEQPADAANAFLKYYALETDPQYAENRLEAKFRAAEQLMYSDNPRAAVPHFQDLLTWLQPGSGMDFDLQSKTAKRIRIDSESYLAWSYDLAAENIRPDIRTINQRIRAAEERIETYQEQQEVATTRLQEAKDYITGAQQAFAEADDELSDELPQPEKRALEEVMPSKEDMQGWTEDEKALHLKNKRAEAERLAREYVKQTVQRLAGEREQLALEKDEVFARKNELAKDIETLTDELEELIKEREETAHDLDLTQKNLDKLTARIDQARTAVEKWEQESKKLTQQMSDAREQYRTGDAETKETARETARLAQKELRELTPQLRDARDKLDDLLSTHTQKRLEELRNSRDGLAASLVEIEDKIAQKKQEKTLLEHEVTIQEARLKAIAAKLARNEKLAELIQLPEDQRTAEAKEGDWSQLAEEAVAGAKQVMERKTGKGVFLQRTAQEDIAQIEQAIKETKTVIAQVQEEREPLQKTFEELKTKASEQFEQFVKTYPKSKHVPENLARIGTIALEFENYQRASTYFDRLEKEYPDHSALKQAMFSLGKAQFEVGRTKEAVDAFNRLLADAEGQPTGNLNYIVLNMLEKGQPELALKAANELLERSKDPEHPDYVQLAGGTRENILYRASEAAFQAAKYDQAINNLEKLIEENPKTAHFFRAKILLARAKRAKTPPNLAGAREDLAEVRTLAEDEDIVTQSLIELARTYYAEDTAKGISRGLAQLGQIVLVSDGDVMVLIDEVREEDRSYLEDALYLSAQGHALLGHEDEQALVRKKYQELFPKGRYVEEMQNLPNAKFKSAAAPSAVPETK